MKKILSLVLILIMSLVMSATAFAAVPSDSNDIDKIYKEAYNECKTKNIDLITDDYGAYAYLLNNIDEVNISDTKITVSQNIYDNLKHKEVTLLDDFVKRLNVLIEKDAVSINSNLEIAKKSAPIPEVVQQPRAIIIDLMPEARAHATELKTVYDNAVFGSKHIVAGAYFAERVKGGGIWDYKVYLGTNTRYYESEIHFNGRRDI